MPLRRRSIAVIVVVALLSAVLGFLAYAGWFGGPVFRLYPATVAAPAHERGTVAVFLSGDSGMNIGMAPKVVQAIADRGVPVLAVNTLTAFARRRTPEQARAIVAGVMRRALTLGGARRVILIGQSFGADMVQWGVAGMPADLRPRIVQVILVVPGETLLFKATPGGFLDGAPDRPALPSARAVDWLPVTCIHGAEETNGLCPLLHCRNVRIVTLPGDHYLRHDAAAVTAAIWRAMRRGG